MSKNLLEKRNWPRCCDTELLYFGGNSITWVSSARSLRSHVNVGLNDRTDCEMNCSSIIGYVNKL